MKKLIFLMLTASAAAWCLPACGGSATVASGGAGGSGGGNGGSSTTSSANGGASSSSSSANGGAGGSCQYETTSAEGFCVYGDDGPNGGQLVAGGPLNVVVFPLGCYSSTCTTTHNASCNIVGEAAGELEVSADFCVEPYQDPNGCTEDCGGVPAAECSQTSIAEGKYTLTLDGMTMEISVPSSLPPGGECVFLLADG